MTSEVATAVSPLASHDPNCLGFRCHAPDDLLGPILVFCAVILVAIAVGQLVVWRRARRRRRERRHQDEDPDA